MLIDTKLLSSYGAIIDFFNPGDIIFEEGDTPKYYYQIISGNVKLNYTDEDARELILSILTKGQSVCEVLLFIDKKYPVTAVAITECSIMKITKSNFMKMLDMHPLVPLKVCQFLSERLYYTLVKMRNNASINAEVRINGMLTYFKSFSDDEAVYSFMLPLTRQQLASCTGLRIETVIRCIKKMEREKIVKIIKGKVFF